MRDLRLDHFGLTLATVAAAVEPGFGDEERAIARNVLEARQICLERRLPLEEDIERDDIKEWQVEVLGARIIHVRRQSTLVLFLCSQVQALDEPLDLSPAMPADDRRGNLTADDVAEHRSVARAHPNLLAHPCLYGLCSPAIVQERDVLFPREAHHDSKPLLDRQVHQPLGRNVVGAHCI